MLKDKIYQQGNKSMVRFMTNNFRRILWGTSGLLCAFFALGSAGPVSAGFEYVPSQGMNTVPVAATPAVMISDIVQGGGQNVPLSMALKQILPPHVGFAPGEGANMAAPVSWTGGRPWRAVLAEVLTSVGLTAIESGNVFLIHSTAPVVAPAVSVSPATGSVPSPVPALKLAEQSSSGGEPYAMQAGASAAPVELVSMGGASSAPSPLPAGQVWAGERGATLRTVLQDWSRKAGVDLYWSTNFDYPIMTAVAVQGDFEQAVNTLLLGFEKAAPQPFGKLHKNAEVGNSVLVIEARGNNYGE